MRFNHTYCFWLSVCSSSELAGPPKGIYLIDEAGYKPKCCGPLNFTMKLWFSHTPVSSCENSGVSHYNFPSRHIRKNKLEELKMQNKQSLICEQLIRDSGEC